VVSVPNFFQSLPLLHESDHVQGLPDCSLIVMEYGDYQCPQSKQFYDRIQTLRLQFADRLCFVFRHFPQQVRSQRAAESAEAAGAQNKFWEMHTLLFAHPHQLEDADLVGYADCLGLDIPQFLQEMAAHVHLAKIHRDMEAGRSCGVEAAPTFFMGFCCRDAQNLEVLLLALLNIMDA